MYINRWPLRRSGAGFLAVVIGALGFTGWAGATPLIDAAFAGSYSASDVTLPTSLAAESIAMTFKAGDPNTLLIGGRYPIGAGGKYQSAIYSVPVVRGGDGHVSGFGTPTMFAAAPGPTDVDALYPGLAYGPGGTLFYTYVEGTNTGLGEILPGGTQPAKFAPLGQFAFTERALGLAFVPNWSTGSGQLKVTSAAGSGGRWYDVSLVSLGGWHVRHRHGGATAAGARPITGGDGLRRGGQPRIRDGFDPRQ